MYREYGDEVQFYVVYIREAHALDSYLPKGGGVDPVVEDPTTFWERQEVAQTCMTRLALEEIPALVDSIDDAASRAYDAWPDRLFLIGQGEKLWLAPLLIPLALPLLVLGRPKSDPLYAKILILAGALGRIGNRQAADALLHTAQEAYRWQDPDLLEVALAGLCAERMSAKAPRARWKVWTRRSDSDHAEEIGSTVLSRTVSRIENTAQESE